MRRVAKIMNFGVIYGLSPFGIRQQTGFSAEEGARFIETYFGRYPGIRDYIDRTKEEVKSRGYVETKLGRRRYIHEARARNRNVRAAGERMAINMPIQGTAADIIKIAMIDIQSRLDELDMATKMILQVHDELIFETPGDELEQLKGPGHGADARRHDAQGAPGRGAEDRLPMGRNGVTLAGEAIVTEEGERDARTR